MIPLQLQKFVTKHLGAVTGFRDISWDHGESAVFRVVSRERSAIVKGHRQRRKFRQELHAYSSWLPRLELPTGIKVPSLLAWQDAPFPALLLSDQPGDLLESVSLDRAAELSAHALAGRFLAALHALELPQADPLPLSEAYLQRLAAWCERATGKVPPGIISSVQTAVHEVVPLLQQRNRAACHRDFTPRNWLVTTTGRLTVIDFEHSRPDLPLIDFERMYCGLWRKRPDLQEAFLSGYGRPLTAEDETLLRGTAALGGLSTIVWARQHGDPEFEAHGWDVLDWFGLAKAPAPAGSVALRSGSGDEREH